LPFFSLTATSLSWIVPLSLHDALPIYNSFDTQKVCTFGCPVTAGSHTVVVACNDDKTCIFFLILHCSVIDAHHFTSRPVRRETALCTRCNLVTDTDVCKCTAHHHFMVTTTGTV